MANPLGALVSGIQGILDFFGSLITSIIKAFSDLFSFIFIPSDGYFDNKLNYLNEKLSTKINTQDYEELLTSLQFASRAKAGLPNLTVNIMGQNCTIVDFSYYAKYQSVIYSWVRGLMFILLIFYNFNNIYKLIRGGSLSSATQTINNAKNGGTK